ncbi:hypothetical protein JTE90_017883 [Oedothorax gibbosus]|uniref:Uncharacterized protein n=1 Tax=Oedothorax gibbosus TaxID=931172 RepID=A0AAV6V212_9ARAC|nr:hypothetical protein JTE90_017883 [Oedothorax gibbosus]
MSFMEEQPSLRELNQNTHLKALSEKLGVAMELLSSKGPTAQLWVQYFKMKSSVEFYFPPSTGEQHADFGQARHNKDAVVPSSTICLRNFIPSQRPETSYLSRQELLEIQRSPAAMLLQLVCKQ